jgi:alginate O-acetyltransferase complex protein AlgI
VFFRADDLPAALQYLSTMFGFHQASSVTYDVFYYLDNEIILVLIIGLIGSTPWWQHMDNRLDSRGINERLFNVVTPLAQETSPDKLSPGALASAAILIGIGALCLTYIAAQTYNPFIYFRF